jgi:hypothetical protein
MYSYEKLCASDRLAKEIQESAIVTALDYITTVDSPAETKVYFKAELSEGDETILDGLVDEHVNEPLEENEAKPVAVTEQPDPIAFAQPTHRTKRYATDIVTIAKNTSEEIGFQLPSELWSMGGCLLVENAEFGDYVTASVYDVDSVIPEPYRAALCEAWPVVATYIVKAYVKVEVPGTVQAGSISNIEVLTHPLIAKITAGLYLRLTYHAVDSGLTRRAAVNYYLLKKL